MGKAKFRPPTKSKPLDWNEILHSCLRPGNLSRNKFGDDRSSGGFWVNMWNYDVCLTWRPHPQPIFTGRQRSCKPCTSYDRHVRPSVRLSVRLSVTRWHWVKTTQARITKSSPTDSPRTLVFGIKNSSRNSTGVTPSEGVKWEWGRKNSQFSANNSPYLRNGAR